MVRFTFFLSAILLAGCSGKFSPVQEISVNPNASTADEVDEYIAAELDWPGWRGPGGNGIADSPPPPVTWSETENVVWQTTVPGRGHSSPVVCGNQVLLATALEAGEQQLVLAYDRDSGAENWRTVLHTGGFPGAGQLHPKGTHANGTLACDDQHIFTAMLNGNSIIATALDFDGEIVWQTTLGKFNSKFGYAPSPQVFKSLVIFAADHRGGGYLAALHRRSGEIVWRKARSRTATYSSAVVAHVAGRDQLLISGAHRVSSYDPNTGEQFWSCKGTTEATCGTMVWNDSMVFASGGHPGRQTLGVLADGSRKVVWSNSTKNYEPSMLVAGDELYATTDNGVAYCWDSKSGQTHWKKRLGGSFSASTVLCDGVLYACNTSGMTFVFKASSERYEQVAKNKLGDDAFASPAICGGQIFLRVGTQQSGRRQEMLYCIGTSASRS